MKVFCWFFSWLHLDHYKYRCCLPLLRGESDTLSYLHLLPCPALTHFTECTTDQWWGASACKDMQCSSSAHYCTSTTGGASAWWTFGRSTRRPQCRPATRRSWCHQEVLSSATPVQEVSPRKFRCLLATRITRCHSEVTLPCL